MNLKEIQDKYTNGLTSRKDAILQTYPTMKTLFDLNDLLQNSIIEKIEIDKNAIVFTVSVHDRDIKICAEPGGALSIASTILATNTLEEEIEDSLNFLIEDGGIIFDIGANVGWYTINIKKECDSAEIYSFEPIPDTYQYLLKNMSLNNLNTDRAYNLGFFNENNNVNFYFNQECTESSSMRDLHYVESESKIIPCKVMKLDDFCMYNKINRIDLIKCDVEGAEYFVYQGGVESIKKFRPIIISEMLRKWSAKFEYHPNDIIRFFAELQYECIALNRDGRKRVITSVNDSTIETNYLFIPVEKKNKIYEKLKNLEL